LPGDHYLFENQEIKVMKERIVTYRGKHIDVYFTVDRCTHVAECIRGAPRVFDVTRRPWIRADAAEPDKVAEVILRCPTGALHFKRKDGGAEEAVPAKNTVTISRHGPLYLQGDLDIRNFDESLVVKDTRVALCRCGASRIMPLCDKNHFFIGFRDKKDFSPGKIHKIEKRGSLIITLKLHGPFHLKGPVEIRNPEGECLYKGENTILCRCGHSGTMPFCDGSHVKAGFKTKREVVLYSEDHQGQTF